MSRGTKIVATIGPASQDFDTLVRMIRAGVDVVRLNFSHG
jgi:pyruvate kinase